MSYPCCEHCDHDPGYIHQEPCLNDLINAPDVVISVSTSDDEHGPVLCPGDCGCRLGTDDADRFECGCEEGCCDENPV